MRRYLISLYFCFLAMPAFGQDYLLVPDRVFDGESIHEGWVVLVSGRQIEAAGPVGDVHVPDGTERILLAGTTLSPGMIEGHSHILLHPYDEAAWNDQVLKESRSLRVARGTVHARNTLRAGFTTMRDLGSEGAAYADVGIKMAIDQGIIPGPRMLVAGAAIVATGSYGPKGFHSDFNVPLGAEPADGVDLIRVTRNQIGKGADVIKFYADYRWGPNGEARPSFSVEEISSIVKTAANSGRPVIAHAATADGMRNAVLGGAETIEHGDGGTAEVFQLMARAGVAWFPTLAAGEAISTYSGWKKGIDPDPERVAIKKQVFRLALEAGVIIGAGGDVGVYTHGDNAWELELMVEYGMTPLQVMRAATSLNARILHLDDRLGSIRPGLLADLVALEGNPVEDIRATRAVRFVMKGGEIVRHP